MVPNCFIEQAFKSRKIQVNATKLVQRDFIHVADICEFIGVAAKYYLSTRSTAILLHNGCSGFTHSISSISLITKSIVESIINEKIDLYIAGQLTNIDPFENLQYDLKVLSKHTDLFSWKPLNSSNMSSSILSLAKAYQKLINSL